MGRHGPAESSGRHRLQIRNEQAGTVQIVDAKSRFTLKIISRTSPLFRSSHLRSISRMISSAPPDCLGNLANCGRWAPAACELRKLAGCEDTGRDQQDTHASFVQTETKQFTGPPADTFCPGKEWAYPDGDTIPATGSSKAHDARPSLASTIRDLRFWSFLSICSLFANALTSPGLATLGFAGTSQGGGISGPQVHSSRWRGGGSEGL